MTIDFTKIIKDLQAAGFTQTEIAANIHCNQANVSAILRGRRPSYDLGSRIIEFHGKVVK